MAASWRICKANQREGKLQFVRHEAQRSYVAHVVGTFNAGDRGLADFAAARIALVASSAGILAMSNLPAPQVLLSSGARTPGYAAPPPASPRICRSCISVVTC